MLMMKYLYNYGLLITLFYDVLVHLFKSMHSSESQSLITPIFGFPQMNFVDEILKDNNITDIKDKAKHNWYLSTFI